MGRYGWSHDNTDGCRKRNRNNDVLLDTLVVPDRSRRHRGKDFHWKIALDPGVYNVTLGMCDPEFGGNGHAGSRGKLNGQPFDLGTGQFLTFKETTIEVELADSPQ